MEPPLDNRICLAHDHFMVTDNVKYFSQVPGLKVIFYLTQNRSPDHASILMRELNEMTRSANKANTS
jgi:hypothetical protein